MSHDLVVLSHLRWVFVWQRPQHLISRLSRRYDRTWFIEEPLNSDEAVEPRLRTEEHEHVTRVWLELPPSIPAQGYDPTACALYIKLLPTVMTIDNRTRRTVWLYTPMARDVAHSFRPNQLVYDVMDDLAAFRFAPDGLVLRQRQVLREADVVFTGGRSLLRGIVDHRADAHCFPSGVEPEHYAAAIAERGPRERPVAGYVGVIDERLDLDLLAGLAAALPDWDIEVVGPVVKIDVDSLPAAPNLRYPGPRPYTELPDVMAGFDVGLMPFALNEATRSISPTKTLEYLAAGLPVVSTRVPDVVADYEGIVDLADDAAGFAAACQARRSGLDETRAARAEAVLHRQHWDSIAARMEELMTAGSHPEVATEEETA